MSTVETTLPLLRDMPEKRAGVLYIDGDGFLSVGGQSLGTDTDTDVIRRQLGLPDGALMPYFAESHAWTTKAANELWNHGYGSEGLAFYLGMTNWQLSLCGIAGRFHVTGRLEANNVAYAELRQRFAIAPHGAICDQLTALAQSESGWLELERRPASEHGSLEYAQFVTPINTSWWPYRVRQRAVELQDLTRDVWNVCGRHF